jgi:hypothetical protein
MKKKPVVLKIQNRTVYQVHNYLQYQVFENLASLVGPWGQIQAWLFIGIVVVGLIMAGLFLYYKRTNKPFMDPRIVGVSSSFWGCFFAGLAIFIVESSYRFGCKFCTTGANMDFIPWLIGSSIVLVFFVVGFIVALFLYITNRPCGRASWRINQPIVGTPTAVGGASDPSPTVESTNGTRPKWFCCHPGCGSCCTAAKGAEPGKPVLWDCGLCCGLQCGIISTVGILVLIWFWLMAFILPTYWWMERHLDGLFGFALIEDQPYTAPLWMGEFGGAYRTPYWLNFVRYLSQRDIDWAHWAINGIKFAEGALDTASGDFTRYATPRWEDESFGILQTDYKTLRNPWMMLDLQALMESPSRWTPDGFPCLPNVHKNCNR